MTDSPSQTTKKGSFVERYTKVTWMRERAKAGLLP